MTPSEFNISDEFVRMPPSQPAVEGLENVRAFLTGMVGQMVIEEDVVSAGVVLQGHLTYDHARRNRPAGSRRRSDSSGREVPMDLLAGSVRRLEVRGPDVERQRVARSRVIAP